MYSRMKDALTERTMNVGKEDEKDIPKGIAIFRVVFVLKFDKELRN